VEQSYVCAYAVCKEDLLRFVSFESKFLEKENGLNEKHQLIYT
jgi:hypothetical protein